MTPECRVTLGQVFCSLLVHLVQVVGLIPRLPVCNPLLPFVVQIFDISAEAYSSTFQTYYPLPFYTETLLFIGPILFAQHLTPTLVVHSLLLTGHGELVHSHQICQTQQVADCLSRNSR